MKKELAGLILDTSDIQYPHTMPFFNFFLVFSKNLNFWWLQNKFTALCSFLFKLQLCAAFLKYALTKETKDS